MKIIVGLGNPGEKYWKTRHNIGFTVIDRFAQQLNMDCNNKKFHALFGKKAVEGEEVILLKPQTFMNLSGIAVKEAISMYKCALQDLMVVYDDLDIPPGRIRIRRSGGSGGHRGLESIVAHLGNTNFSRLRIGIGRPSTGGPANYVLSPFSKDEEVILSDALEKACHALKVWIFDGIETCMNNFN